MKIEHQLTSPDISMKMEKMGFEQDSLFYWIVEGEHFCSDGTKSEEGNPIITDGKPPYNFPYKTLGSAYTASEIMNILPYNIYITKGSIYRVDYPDMNYYIKNIGLEDCLGEMACYLKENNLI